MGDIGLANPNPRPLTLPPSTVKNHLFGERHGRISTSYAIPPTLTANFIPTNFPPSIFLAFRGVYIENTVCMQAFWLFEVV